MTEQLDDARGELLALADEIEASPGLMLMGTWGGPTQLGIKKTAQVVAALRRPAPVPQCEAGPVAWTNVPQLGFLKDPACVDIPMAMWANKSKTSPIPLYATPPSRSDAESVEALEYIAEIIREETRTTSDGTIYNSTDVAKAILSRALVPPPAEAGREMQALLDILDVSVPDDGLLKGKLMMAIGHKGAQMCWTPQNSYEHAVINLLGCKLRDLRVVPPPSEAVREVLIHAICPHIKQWSDGEDVVDKTCKKCPATVETSHGTGVQMCRLNAEKAADAVLALSDPGTVAVASAQYRCTCGAEPYCAPNASCPLAVTSTPHSAGGQ